MPTVINLRAKFDVSGSIPTEDKEGSQNCKSRSRDHLPTPFDLNTSMRSSSSQTMLFRYELACKDHSTEKAQELDMRHSKMISAVL